MRRRAKAAPVVLEEGEPLASMLLHAVPTSEEREAREARAQGAREVTGVTAAELARRRQFSSNAVHDAVHAGDGVRVATLREYARALRGRIEIVFVPDPPDEVVTARPRRAP